MSNPTLNQENLDELLAEWQKTLRLQDWGIQVLLGRIFDMVDENTTGQCTWRLSNKTALIRILDPSDYNPSFLRPCDVEKTLVHELLHLHFAPFCPLGSETDLHEQAIEAIATGLVKAKRGGEVEARTDPGRTTGG